MESKCVNRKLSLGWFLVMFVNFLIGVGGIIICTLKLKYYAEDDEIRIGYFKLSMVFAACNLLLSVMLLVSVLKSDQKYAFLYALLIFLSLFAATVHIESNTNHTSTFLIIFIVFALLCFLWFGVFGTYQVWLRRIKNNSEDIAVV